MENVMYWTMYVRHLVLFVKSNHRKVAAAVDYVFQ